MNKELSKEEILRKNVCKDCIWEEAQHLTNTPMEEVYAAMQEYSDQENKELKEKVTELETVIAKLSQKILNKSNY